jgi:[NiFe] hydrogenase assembly HybE family chaperone
MTSAAAAPASRVVPAQRDRPDPSSALVRRFEAIWQTQMQGVPLLNPALRVQAVGFRPWAEHWLGMLVTPWFMNLLLLPRCPAAWADVPERASRHHVFPAGVFEFIGCQDAVIGNHLACSLFSPMFEFGTHTGAVQTAEASLQLLFQAPGHGQEQGTS